jgi:hypothetical protein
MPRPIFFHIHANTWHCKRFIHALEHEGHWLVSEASKVEALFSFFDGIPGTVPQRLHSIDLGSLNPPHLPLSEMGGSWNMKSSRLFGSCHRTRLWAPMVSPPISCSAPTMTSSLKSLWHLMPSGTWMHVTSKRSMTCSWFSYLRRQTW